MKQVLIVLGVLLVLGIGALVAVYFVSTGKFGPMAEKILADAEAGNFEAVHAASSSGLRKEASVEKLRQIFGTLREALGPYKRVVKKTGGGLHASTEEGTRGSVNLELEYEKGTAKSTFTFVKEGDDWKLVAFEIKPDAKPPPEK
jgi:hypothetical protein